ncbi:hypothetical protein Kisp01_47570 [Kineosporia sp. NBRC 101677]|uniref:HNH endonuclease signature motif containing protein n=1 Tax=Kineosporia sp. NBRC 101677 TaxID=3032197 RepID=UPI0024A05B87|nr:HNH endonuclease [Kineosporia sp. NBRC 101677]GLY17743.1 hypothetical protein Kisp01_47570 [Kineosporia sp. NBRC 101677]
MRRLQAAQMRSLVAAVEAMPVARRRGSRAGRQPVGQNQPESNGALGSREHEEDPDGGQNQNGGELEDSAQLISSRKLVSSRLAPELNRHPLSAAGDVQEAIGLVRDLPRVFALLEQGRLDGDRARLVTRRLHGACERYPQLRPANEQWLLLEAMVAAQAPDLTYGQLDRLIKLLLQQLDPDGGAARHAQALRGRNVQVQPQPDGMALVTALISAEAGQLLDGFLDAAADAARDRAEAEGLPDERTHDQRRADVLAMLVQALSEGLHIPLVPDPRHENDEEFHAPPAAQPATQPTAQPAGETAGESAAQPAGEPASKSAAQPTGKSAAQPVGEPVVCSAGQRAGQPGDEPDHVPGDVPGRTPGDARAGCSAEKPTEEPGREPGQDGSRGGNRVDVRGHAGAHAPGPIGEGGQAGGQGGSSQDQPESLSGQSVPDSFRRRPQEDQQTPAANLHHDMTTLGFAPVPEGLMPAWWRIPDLPRVKGRGPHLVVTITDTTLLGLDQIPGLLQGHGVISAEQARRLAVAPSQVTLLVLPGACAQPNSHSHMHTDARADAPAHAEADGMPPPTADHSADSHDFGGQEHPGNSQRPGRPDDPTAAPPCPVGLDHDQPRTSRYRPGRTLTNQVTARYPTCTFPGCTTPASRCDLDHLRPFRQGGLSCACNMHPACRGHHRLKTFAHWHARPARPDEPYPPGTIIWTTPDGTDHPSPPPLLPGMPGWTLPTRTPDYPAQPESLTRIDLMPSAERTTRRTNRWARALQWQADQQDRQRRAALKQAAKQAAKAAAALRPPLARPKHAPWGESTGVYPEYGEPTF